MRASFDADWGGCKQTRRSTSAYIFAANGSPIFWKPKYQTIVTLASGEAEYVYLSSRVKDVSWLRRMILEVIHRSTCNDESRIPQIAIEINRSAAMEIASNRDSTKL